MLGKKLDFYVLKVGGVVVALGLVFAGIGLYVAFYSNQFTDVGYQPKQPIAFSHKLHAGELQISCFYCHSNAEKSANATVPATQTCMNCHSIVKRASPEVQKIVESYEKNKPIEWIRVHKLSDFVNFKHDVHIRAGISCYNCHGKVEEMDVVKQVKPLNMGWCLECHRQKTPLEPSFRAEDVISKATQDEEFHKKIMEHVKNFKGVPWVEEHQRKKGSQNCSSCHY